MLLQHLELNKMKSNISEAIEGYRTCKICGAANTYNVAKTKQIKKPRGTKNLITIANEQIFCREEGPYKVWISDEIIDIKENTYEINAVKDYIFDQIVFRLSLVCSVCAAAPELENDQSEHAYLKKKAFPTYEDDDEFPDGDSPFHYEAQFFVNIDQKTKEITNVNILSEWLENDEFSISKNFANNTTKITKKQRGIRLPFIYDKDFKDFDFGKLLAISSLLK
jgi:hypothetical protein